jgi:hypothetical protein
MIGQVVAVCSTDAGHSFAAPVHLGAEAGAIALPGDVRPNSGTTVAISPQGDAFYVAFPTHKPGSAHSDIVVTASRDRGRTWSKPVTATPEDGVIYFQPNAAVDAAGRVAISAFALANGRMDEVLLVSRAGELHFGPPLRVTTAPFNPLDPTTASRGKYGIWWIGDWQGIASSAGGLPSRVERHPDRETRSLRGHGGMTTSQCTMRSARTLLTSGDLKAHQLPDPVSQYRRPVGW